MEVQKFGPVWFLPGDKKGGYPYCHSVYIEGDGILIDPASNRERLMELKKDPGVNEIWLSHFHEDHVLNLDLFHDVPLFMNKVDALYAQGMDAFLDSVGVDSADRNFFRQYLKEYFHFPLKKPDGFIEPGNIPRVASVSVTAISTPGHTPGHLSFYFNEPGILFMGDYDLTNFGPWYGDKGSDIDDTIRSVNLLRSWKSNKWVVSHVNDVLSEVTTDMWDNYLSVISEREERLIQALATPKNKEELIDQWVVYKRPRNPAVFYRYAEWALIGKHLEKMIQDGRVIIENGRYTDCQKYVP